MATRKFSMVIFMLGILTLFSEIKIARTFSSVVVVAPNVFRIGVEETIFIQPIFENEDTQLTISLHRAPPGTDEYARKIINIKNDEAQVTTLTLNATAKPLISDIKNYIGGIKAASSDIHVVMKASIKGIVYYKSPLIKVALNSGIIFLQTDKPIYLPGQEVKLRIILTDNSLKAYSEKIILEVINPKNLVVYREEMNDFSPSQILKHSYSLGPEPIFGLWTINVRSGFQFFTATNTTFEVKEYVLPTFDVHIDFPQKYIMPETRTLAGKVIARYTFEENVEGSVALQYFIHSKSGELQKAFNETVGNLTAGEFPFKVDLAELRTKSPSPLLSSWFPGIIGSRLKLVATVTESGTLTRETRSNEATMFVTSPYIISFKRSLPDFKPGYSYTIQVDVHYTNGDPAVSVPVLVSEVSMGTLGTQQQPPQLATNSRGRAAFTVAVPLTTSELLATVVTKDPKYSKASNARKMLKLQAHQPTIGHGAGYLWIQPQISLDDVRIGTIMRVDATVYNPNNLDYAIYYFVVSRGRVVSWGRPTSQHSTYLWVLNVEVKPEMSPSFRLVVYAIQGNPAERTHFLADSIRVEVENKCLYNDNKELKLSLSKDIFAPKSQGFLKVNGERDSYVGVMAIDEAIYSLRNESILTRSKLFTDLDKNDIGHGPGGGRTVGEILKNAGIVVLIPGDQLTEYQDAAVAARTKQKRRLHFSPPTSQMHDCCAEASRSHRLHPGSCIMSQELFCSYHTEANKRRCATRFQHCCPAKAFLYTDATVCQHAFALDEDHIKNFGVLHSVDESAHSKEIRPLMPGEPGVRGLPGAVLPLPVPRLKQEAGRIAAIDGEQHEDEDFDDEELFADPTDIDTRTKFPETWLYEDFQLGGAKCPYGTDDKVCQFTIDAFPDSITSWNFHGLAVSKKSGFCIADPIKATVKKTLFIKLKLPYAAVRTEVLELVATVFNYGIERQRVLLYINGVDGLCCEAKPGARGKIHRLMVPTNGAVSHRFYIIPKKTGEFPINVTARSMFGADVIIKKLQVRDEGIRETKFSTQLLDPTDAIKIQSRREILKHDENSVIEDHGKLVYNNLTDSRANVAWDVIPPSEAIPGTVRATLELTGSVLGPTLDTTIDGVEGFFQDAVGCAEQSMIRIAPTLYSALYLKATGQLITESEEKAKKHLTQGYGFVMKYRQSNGGIAVWSGPQYKPTLWLTSYFMRVFCEMRPFVSSVDTNVILSGLKWMATHQKLDGSFDGKAVPIYHVEMTGGLQGVTSLTAFTLASYLACNDIDLMKDAPGVVSKARIYLENQVESLKQHPYSLALVTYVLALANSSKAQQANVYLRNLVQEDEQGNRYWVHDIKEIQSHMDNKPWIYTNKPSGLSVEITAYALLAQVTLNQVEYAGPIVAWLINQRNSKGAFVSTQDTAVTLEALAAYGKIAKQIDKGKTLVDVFVDDNTVNNEPLIFDKTSKNIIKAIEVPVGRKVRVEAKGEIPITTTLQIKYNSPGKSDTGKAYDIEIDPSDVLDLEAEARSKRENRRDLRMSRHVVNVKICIGYALNKSSGMVLARIGIPTGYGVDQTQLREVIGKEEHGITNMESTESSITLYFDKIPQSPDKRCFTICIRKKDDVNELQPSSVKVITYYEPDEESVQFYSVVSGKVDSKENCIGEICSCLKGNCPLHLAENYYAEIDESKMDKLLTQMSQKDQYGYTVKVKSLSLTEDTMHLHQKIIAKVIQVIKEGKEKTNEILQKDREFYLPSKCDSFKVNSYYLLSGKQIEVVKTITNNNSFRYILDDTALVWHFPSSYAGGTPNPPIVNYVVQSFKSKNLWK